MRVWHSSWTWKSVSVAMIGGGAVGLVVGLSPGDEKSFLWFMLEDEFGRVLFPVIYSVVGACVGIAMLAAPYAVATALQARALVWQARAKSDEELRLAVCEVPKEAASQRSAGRPARGASTRPSQTPRGPAPE